MKTLFIINLVLLLVILFFMGVAIIKGYEIQKEKQIQDMATRLDEYIKEAIKEEIANSK